MTASSETHESESGTGVESETGTGTETVSVPTEKRERLCLDDSELHALEELGQQCESYRDGGQDVEWAFADGNCYLLQRRDVTTAPA